MSKLLSSRWLNFFLSFTMVTTQILPAGYTQDANQNFTESPDGRSVPVVSLEAIQEDERAKAEAAQAEKAAMEANSYLMSIKELPISKPDNVAASEQSMMESSSRPAKEVKLHSQAEVEEMAAMMVRSYLGNKSVKFEYKWNHPFMYASEQVVDQDNPTLFTPQQGSLTLSRKLGDGVTETYTLTIGDQGLLLSNAEVKSGDRILSSISWGYDSNGVKNSESKTENLYDEAGNQIESRNSWKNMTADGTVTNESATETTSKYDGKNLVSQTTKSSSRYDNNGAPQTSESSTVLERKYFGDVVIYELITSQGSQNGVETSGSTSTKKVELDAAGHPVYSITESNSWSSYNGTKSEYSYSTVEKSAYNENGDLIEKVTRWENKSTGYSSSSETHLFNTYEGGFLVQAVTKSSSTYNGNQNSSWSTVTNYKRDAAGRPVFEETTSSYNGVENSRSSIERTYLDEKSEKLTSEITKNFYLQGNSLQLNYQQSLKLEYNKAGVLLKTHHQQDSFYGQDHALSYRSTVETAYNTDGKPVSVISKSYYLNENELVLQSSSELKYRYSDKDADGKTHVTYSSRTEMNADGSVIYKEIKRYDPRFSMENPSVSEPRVMYDIAMPAYSYYMPVYWGWGGGLEKGLLSREMQYFSTDENGDAYLTSTSGDRYWLDGEGKAIKQRNYTKNFNQDGDKTSQITQEYDLIGQQYNYGCCYQVMNGDVAVRGENTVMQASGQGGAMGIRADSMMYRPYPYYYNSGRRLTLYDELRYDESGEVNFRKTQRNEYADGLLVSAKLVIKDGDVTRTIKETYAFDALGRASKIIRQVYGPKGVLELTDERTYEYSGFGYSGYGYYRSAEYAAGGVASSDKMMGSAIWAPWNAASVKSVRVVLTNHMTGESVKAFISYTNMDPRESSGEGQLIAIPYDYYGGVSYNAADITGTYTNSKGVVLPIEGRFKSNGNDHALPTEKLMELLISYAGKSQEISSPVVKGVFSVIDGSMPSTLMRSVYAVTGENKTWLIDRLPEWRKILDKLDGMNVSFIPGKSFSLEGKEIFTSGILITEDGRAYVLADGKIKQYKNAQFITMSESKCPANPMMGAPCSLTENAMKMPGYETLHQHEEVLLDGIWIIRRNVVLIALPDDGTVAEIKSDEQLLSELHQNSKVLIYEEFDHVATACAPIDGAVCASAKKVFYSYLRENGDRVYQIASINETRVFGGNDVKRTANVVSEADLERALHAAGFHALQDSGDIFSGIIDYNKMHVEKYEELPGDATDDLRSIPYHVIYSVLDCPDGAGVKSCATENYEARVIKSRIQIPEADSYLKYEVSFINETRLIVNYEGGQAYIDWIAGEDGSLIRTDVKTGEEAKFMNARDVMSCRTSADGMMMCASLAFGPDDVQIGSYTKKYPDGSYEERIIMGIPADKNPPVKEKGSPVVTGIFQVPDDSMMSTLQRSVYTIEGENESWLIDRLEELRGTLDKLHGQKVSFIPGKSFSLEGREIFTSGIIITGDGIAFVLEDGKIKAYKDVQFLKVSESRCPANPAMGAPCSIEEIAMKMPGYEQIHQHQEVSVEDGWIVTRTIVLIGIPFEYSDPSEYKTDETLLSELHNGVKVQIYEEFDHAATACAPMLGARCSSTKNVFYSYLLNGDRVYQIAAINEISIYGRNITHRSANVVSEADLERALRAAGFHALQDSGDIFSGIINYNKMHVEKYEELPGDATDDLRSIPYHVIYSVLDCPDGAGLKSCATENYEARVIKSRIQIPEADSYLKYEVSFLNETRLIVNYEGGQAYIDWISDEEGSLIRTDVKTGEEVKFFKALDMMSCHYPKDGPAMCAGIAILPGYEQVGSYRKDLPDGGYEERIIMGLRSENLPIEEKGSPVVTGIFQMPDDSMMSTLQRSVYTIEGENESWLIDRLEEFRGTLDKLHGQKVSFIPGKSFSLEGREIFTSGIIITGDGIAFVLEDGKIKAYKDVQFLKVSESRCPANPAMGAPCSIEEIAMKMPGYEQIHQHQEVSVEDGWIVTRTIVLIGIPFEFNPNFIPVEKMDAAEADRIRKAVGEGLELLGYEIDDGRPYDGNLVHHYAFRAHSSSLVHMQQATNSNIIKQDANGLIYEERALEDFGLDVFVNSDIRYIKEPDPRYIEVSAGVSRIEVAPGEQLMLSVVMELGGRRIMTLRDIHTPWTFTPLTPESAFRIKAAIHHGLEMKQIGKVRMKLTGETAAKCPQGEKCSSYKEYEVLYFADGKEFLADGQIILTTFEGKQFTYYEIQNVREAMSKEEKIRLAIEAAGQDLEALAAQMIIPENQALTEEEFAALDAKLKEIAEKMRALLVALREKIREIEGENASGGIIKMFGGPDAAVRLEQRAGALLSDFYGRLMRTDALIIAGGQKIRIPVHKMTEILIGALPNGRWSPAEDYAQLIGYTPEFHPGDGIYLMNVFQNVMLSLAMGPSSRDLRQMVITFVLKSNAKGLIEGGTINLKVFKRLLLGIDAKINLAIKAAGEDVNLMLKGFSVPEVLSEKEVEALLADLDSLYQKIRSRLAELKKQIDELESANQDPSEPVLFMQVGGGPDAAVRIERDAEMALGNYYGLIVSRDVRIKTADGSEVVLPLSKMIEILSAVVGKDQMYSVEAIGKVLGRKVEYDSGRIYFMHVFQFMMASRAAVPDVRTALIEYVRGSDMPAMMQDGKLDLNLFRLSLLGARAKMQEAVAEAYLKAASDAGVFFFKAPEIGLKKMTITSMSKNLPPTEFGLEVIYTADGGGELSASVQLSITADGIKASVNSIKTPFGDSSEEIARAVIADLSKRTGLSSDNFKVQSVEARNWPDGCLGLPEPGTFCTMAIVPGYRIVIVDAAGKNYVYRTGRTAGLFKLEPEKEAPSMKLAALPSDVEAGYKGFNAGRTILSLARGYGKVSEVNAEAGMKKFDLISDNRSSATAQGEFVFTSEKGFSLDALTGLSFKGSMKNFMLVFVDAAGKSIQQKVSLKNSQTETILGIDFSANPDFDASNIRSFRILHSQRERVELTVGYALLPDTKNIVNPAPQESFELEGKTFDASRLTSLPQGVHGDVFGTTVEEGKGLAAYASLLDSSDGKKVTYHFAGSDAGMAGYEVSFGSNADSSSKREIALKGDGKAVELVMVRENGEVVTKTVVLPKDFMNYELESGIKQLFIRTSRLMAGHEKGSFMIRFGNQPPSADKLVAYGRNTVPERLRTAISKLRDAHKTWKERYNSRKFSFTKAK